MCNILNKFTCEPLLQVDVSNFDIPNSPNEYI